MLRRLFPRSVHAVLQALILLSAFDIFFAAIFQIIPLKKFDKNKGKRQQKMNK